MQKPCQFIKTLKILLKSYSYVFLIACFFGCRSSQEETRQRQLVVSAAMSLMEVFGEFEKRFEAEYPDVDVVMNFAGSQILAGQIIAGAEVDVFVSANPKQMERVVAAGRVKQTEIIAYNQLILVTPVDNPQNIRSSADLTKQGVRIVLADADVPAGDYSRKVLQELGILSQVMSNVVSHEEDVRGVVAKLVLGEADAGIVYATDISSHTQNHLYKVQSFPSRLSSPHYEIAVITDGSRFQLAQTFLASLKTEQAKQVWRDFQFTPP